MIPEIGHFALILALCLATFQWLLPMVSLFSGYHTGINATRTICFGQAFFVILSYACLTAAFINQDFSVRYVAEHSYSELPLFYRMCAVWGGHEGSVLLWVLILNFWSVAVAIAGRRWKSEEIAGVLAILGMVSVSLLTFILLTSNPFLRDLPLMPIEGQDLNPLLQDPGFLIHPPMLYTGYVGFTVTYAMALYALITGKFELVWAQRMRSWALLAWCFLTIGITLGSWWAYRVLGWGGWWGWDPVENASLLPWLVGTALVHSLLVSARRASLKTWTVLLAILTFSLSLLGTFLVRSGVLTSVHAFAVDPKRGAYILGLLVVLIGGSLAIYAWRGRYLKSEFPEQVWSRAGTVLLNNILLLVLMFTILLGTLYPLLIDAFGFGKLSVGPQYFNSVILPLSAPLLLLMGIGPLMNWNGLSWTDLWKRARWRVIAAVSLSLLPLLFLLSLWMMTIGIVSAVWIITGALGGRAHSWGMSLAHTGFALFILGIAFNTNLSLQQDLKFSVGESTQIAGKTIQWKSVTDIVGPNYDAVRGDFIVSSAQQETHLFPEKRIYHASQMPITAAAIDAGFWSDWYIALGAPINNQDWSVRIYYKPFIRWIWLGALIMLAGGLTSLFTHRRQSYGMA